MADDPTTSPTRPAHAGPGAAAADVRRTHRALLVYTLVLAAAADGSNPGLGWDDVVYAFGGAGAVAIVLHALGAMVARSTGIGRSA
ncbi:hypothetical protein [Brachybacterium huguangmaarense]